MDKVDPPFFYGWPLCTARERESGGVFLPGPSPFIPSSLYEIYQPTHRVPTVNLPSAVALGGAYE